MLTERNALAKDRRNADAPLRSPLTHRTFAVVAGIIRDIPDPVRADVARRFADALASTNPNFSRARFLRACQAD